MSNLADEIIKEASKFLDFYETKENARWKAIAHQSSVSSEDIETMLKQVGWKPGWAYCMAFSEAVVSRAYKNVGAPNHIIAMISEMLNPSVMSSFNNVKSRKLDSSIPEPGSIFFMQKGFTGNGHAGIVIGYNPKTKEIATIEANTSPGVAKSVDQDRNGDGIYRKIRVLDFEEHQYKLHLKGFLNPIRWRTDGTIIEK